MSVDTLMSIKVFRTVVELGSFVAASERLDLSPAMVSRHVMHVEERIGVRLLNRNSRTLSLTEAGAVYFERCKTILDDLEATELELGALGTAPRGTLRITAPSWTAGQRMQVFWDNAGSLTFVRDDKPEARLIAMNNRASNIKAKQLFRRKTDCVFSLRPRWS